MIIDDEYCQYEMWRIVNKAENDAIDAFSGMNAGDLSALGIWADRYRKAKESEENMPTEENVRESAFAGKMTELLSGPMDLVIIANMASGGEVHFKDTGAFASMAEEFKGLDFFERCERYALKVVKEDRESFASAFSLETLKEKLAENGCVRLTYSVNLACQGQAEDIHEVETAYVYIGGDEALKAVRVIK